MYCSQPLQKVTLGKNKSSQVHFTDTKASLIQLSATTLVPGTKGIPEISPPLSLLPHTQKPHTHAFLPGFRLQTKPIFH